MSLLILPGISPVRDRHHTGRGAECRPTERRTRCGRHQPTGAV